MTDEWVRPLPDRRGVQRDLVGALVLAVGAALSTMLYTRVGMFDEPAPPWLSLLALAAVTLPLALRRRHPEIVAVVVSTGFFVAGQFAVPEALITQITMFVAIYSVGAWSRSRRRADIVRLVIIVFMFGWVAVNLIVTVSDPEMLPDVSRSGVFSAFASFAVINFATNILYFGGAWYFGNHMWLAARERAELERRTAELQEEREHSMRQAVALDRVRIARELHDVVAHHVSVMGVQAGAARRVLDRDPGQATESLEVIETNARAAVDELHRLLTTLRDPDAAGPGETDAATESASTRGLEQLGDLVEATRAAGTPTTLVVVGEKHPVTTMVGFTLYRVAQEALTNVRKHAGERAEAEVRLRYIDGRVELEVTDTGRGRGLATSVSGGLGHIGMRERLAAVGGTLETGPRTRGGYLVRAVVPLGGTSAPQPVAAAGGTA
ncbi:sensor histidine kinase [Salinibacterium sp. SYSU T00001]|uniref:sensor histidine kinase n=1 Tax=Homoserinimonas sedimenticola TaxID=2986805 RepID=UPI00223622BE|nr:sensor histidine kinase [Salinibacterium sedimenticola]MCW4385582.1 sensor histidine kinase [Salinibacterium sedimenticola]